MGIEQECRTQGKEFDFDEEDLDVQFLFSVMCGGVTLCVKRM